MAQDANASAGYDTSWADISVTIQIPGGATLKNLKSNGLKFGAKLDSSRSQETGGGRMTGDTTGSVKNDGSIGLTRKAITDLEEALTAVAPMRDGAYQLAIPIFKMVIKHVLVVDPDTIYTTELEACRYRSMVSDMKPGNEADYLDVTIDPGMIYKLLPSGKKVCLL